MSHARETYLRVMGACCFIFAGAIPWTHILMHEPIGPEERYGTIAFLIAGLALSFPRAVFGLVSRYLGARRDPPPPSAG